MCHPSASVSKDKDTLMVTSGSQSVFNVCEEFGKYVKFVVEIGEEACALQSLGTARNAFAVMLAAQRQVQQGDNGVPLTIQVKTSKDRLYDDLVKLMKELGVKWFDPNLYAVRFLKKNFAIACGTLTVIIRRLRNVHPKYLHYSRHFPAIIVLRGTSIAKELLKICEHQSYVLIRCHFKMFCRQAGSKKNRLQH